MSARLRIRKKGDTEETVIDLPPVQTYEYSFQSSLTEISTMVYGYRNNFCMDLGNTLRINVSFERINPQPYSDDSKDPDVWSNGKWYRYLESCLDYWQNNAMDVDDPTVQAGGARFEFVPDDLELFPIQGYNVFVIGNLNMTYKTVQTITFTIPMVASRMIGNAKPLEKVTLYLRTYVMNTETIFKTEVTVPKGYNVPVPECPSAFYDKQPGKIFIGWVDESGRAYSAGSSVVWTGDTVLFANWKSAQEVHVYSEEKFVGVETPLTVPLGITRAVAYVVGGGGGAGGSAVAATGTDISGTRTFMKGGGGGAGQAKKLSEREVYPGDILTIYVGRGGTGGTNKTEGGGINSTDGGDGKASYILVNGIGWDGDVKGGAGGKSTRNGGAGGQQYMPGGSYDANTLDGADGATASPNVAKYAGKKGAGTYHKSGINNSKKYYKHGGNGGGAAAFRWRFSDNDGNWYPSSTGYYTSVGGNGEDYVAETDATDGELGGGGGSGYKEDSFRSGAGGHGAVIVVFYE